MKVVLAKKAGFCLGVRRAVETTIDLVHREKDGIATFGPLIHNPQVLNLLEAQGVSILQDIPEKTTGTVIIRAHGVPPNKIKALKASGAKVQDATCPRVVKVQAIIQKYSHKGYATVIVGDRDHAEVVGLMGYAEPQAHVVSKENDLDSLKLDGPYIIVSQTTQDKSAFKLLCQKILQKFPGGRVFDTICYSTKKRQDEVKSLCEKVEAVVVVGGKNSANTQRLGEIAAANGCAVIMAETEEDLDWQKMKQFARVGVTAGASTPTWMINRVIRALESFPGRGESPVKAFLFKVMWYLLASNLYVAITGGMLAYACSVWLNLKLGYDPFWLACGYLFAMHNFNRVASQEAGEFNNPARLRFFKAFRWPLLLCSVVGLAGALIICFRLGVGPFVLLLWMSILGILYSVPIVPQFFSKVTKFRRLKEISGSKTFFVALAWAFVAVFLPAWGSDRLDFKTMVVLLIVLGIIFVRNALFDVFDLQGDRIVGKETLPVCIGEKRTMQILNGIICLVFSLLILLPALGFFPYWSYAALPALIVLFIIVRLYCKGAVRHGIRLEFGVESVFLLWSLLLLGGRFLSHLVTF